MSIRKSVSLFLSLLLLSITAKAQLMCENWVVDAKNNSAHDHTTAVFESDSGIIVAGGFFQAGSTELELTSYGGQQTFNNTTPIVSQSRGIYVYLKDPFPGSSTLRWSKWFRCTSNAEIFDIAYKNGSVYITGYFYGSITFGSNTFASRGIRDMFLVKLDGNGNVVWAVQEGGPNWEKGDAMVLDDNNVYVTGYYESQANFSGNTLTAATNTDLFVASYSMNTGSLNWVKDFNGSSYKDEGNGITIDHNGDLYVTGYTFGYLQVDNTTLYSNGLSDIFVIKMDNSGTVLWANTFGGIDKDVANDIVYNPVDSNLYIACSWYSTGVSVQGNTITTYGDRDAVIIKMDPSGNIEWAKSGGSAMKDWVIALDVTATGDIIAAGVIGGDFVMDQQTLSNPYPQPDSTGLLLRIDMAGNLMGMTGYGGPGEDKVQDVATGKTIENKKAITVVGFYEGNMTLGPLNFTSTVGHNGFLWSFCDPLNAYYLVMGTEEPALSFDEVKLYPNPAVNLVTIQSGQLLDKVEVYNSIGQLIYTDAAIATHTYQLNTTDMDMGVYFVRTYTGNNTTKLNKLLVTK